jgi:hypothetical protein
MSNTTQEFCAANNPAPCQSWSFVGQAAADSDVNHFTLVFVNGAQGGQSAETWESASNPNYDRVRDLNLRPAGLSERQPSTSGEQRVGSLLLAFFKSEPTARGWFLSQPPPRRRAVSRGN